MTCPHCSANIGDDLQICPTCGSRLPADPEQREPGRSVLILGLGLTSVLLLGPLLGIPAWIMGVRDLRKIRSGIIAMSEQAMTRAGMILGIIGTFVSVLSLVVYGTLIAVGLSLFTAEAIQANRDAMLTDIGGIVHDATHYCEEHEGSFEGYDLPGHLRRTENASYAVEIISPHEMRLVGTSGYRTENTIGLVFDGHGTVLEWSFSGDFD